MHIPDGYLSPSTCATLAVAAAPFWYIALQRVKKALSSRMVPLISIFAAFSFVVMMFNLPLPGGTTGHAVGMGIATIVLGPWGSIIAVSVALILQALLFGDGGILAIGANCFNMAIVGSLVTYVLYRWFAGRSALSAPRRIMAGALAAYIAINVAALVAAIEFGVQPLLFTDANGVPLYSFYPLAVSVPAMLIGHLTIAGIAEAVATGGIIAYLQKADIGLLKFTAPNARMTETATTEVGREAMPKRRRGLVVGLIVLALLSPLGLLAAGTAWGEWSGDQLASEQAGFHLRQMSAPDQTALAAEFAALAKTPTAAQSAVDYEAASQGLQNGNLAPASDAVQAHIDKLRAADLSAYPQLSALTASIKDPQGMKQFSDLWKAPLSGYAPSFIADERLGYILSAVVGIALAALLAFLVGRAVVRRNV